MQPRTPVCRYVERQWLNKSAVGASRLSLRDHASRTNNSVESFHAALRRRVQVAHPNLFVFLGHLKRVTQDTEAARVNRGMSIRRSKKKSNLVNDARIKACISRYDNGTYARFQFLHAVGPPLDRILSVQQTAVRSQTSMMMTTSWRRSASTVATTSRQRISGSLQSLHDNTARHTTSACALRTPALLWLLYHKG